MKQYLVCISFLLIYMESHGQNFEIFKFDKKTAEVYDALSLEFRKNNKDIDKSKRDYKRKFNRYLFDNVIKTRPVQLAIGFGDINGQIYSNLVDDVFISEDKKYLGEISLGSVISNATSDSSKNKDALNINNFFNGGGNLFLKYAFKSPIGYFDGFSNFTFLNVASIRSASNLPKLNQNERFDNWNIEIADEFLINLIGNNNLLGLILKPKVAYVLGSSSFAKSILKVESNSDKKLRDFMYLQLQGAVKVKDSFLITISLKPLVAKDDNLSKYYKENKFATIGIQAIL